MIPVMSDELSPIVTAKINDLVIQNFNVSPQTVNYDESIGSVDPVGVTWNVIGASNVYITINGVTDSVSSGDHTFAYLDGSQTITISAVSGNCSKTMSVNVAVNDGITTCRRKDDYISL